MEAPVNSFRASIDSNQRTKHICRRNADITIFFLLHGNENGMCWQEAKDCRAWAVAQARLFGSFMLRLCTNVCKGYFVASLSAAPESSFSGLFLS